ncbi:hypothetical protein V8E54_007553 [Elaphomyces granulatus]
MASIEKSGISPSQGNSCDALNPSNPVAAVHLSQKAVSHSYSTRYFASEQLMFACLRTGDDKSAHDSFGQLATRFGKSNERIMGLQGLHQEATAHDKAALEAILRDYEKILSENPVNIPILKRRIAILRSLSRATDAISALVEFLEAFPTNSEAWCELSDLYLRQRMDSQAIFCLEEALLTAPNSWNLHALLGEVLYVSATSSEHQESSLVLLIRAMRHFCRSIELCVDYTRGFYGLKLVTSLLLQEPYVKEFSSTQADENNDVPAEEVVRKLHSLAATKLTGVVAFKSNISKE